MDSDRVGVGRLIAESADLYGVDSMNVLFLTPLPGTRLWRQLKAEGRIAKDAFPEDWKYYTLNYPVARYKYLTVDQVIDEMNECNSTFYSRWSILRRLGRNVAAGRTPLFTVVTNFTARRNSRLFAEVYAAEWRTNSTSGGIGSVAEPSRDLVDLWETAARQLRQLATVLRMRMAWFFRQS